MTGANISTHQYRIVVQLPDGTELPAGTLSEDQLGASRLPTPTFRYDADYLSAKGAYALSPDLPLTTGPLRPAQGRTVLGAFGDAMPDDWGRRVMRRGDTQPRTDLDFLAGVRDRHRQGAIRVLKDGVAVASGAGPDFEHHDALLLRWMNAALAFDGGAETDEQAAILLEAGTSAGGARPKVVIEHNNGLRIVKFSRSTEPNNHMAWEGMALELARRSGAEVPDFWVPRLGERLGLMVERFDRTTDGQRVGYISAHTLMQKRDQDRTDYTTLVEDMTEVSSAPHRDAQELFRRIALSVLLNNVDDHMRNHGFLRDPRGWRLAPLFDIEPSCELGRTDATPITASSSGVDRDIRELADNAATFLLTQSEAARVIAEVELGTREWANVAVGFGIHPEQIPVWGRALDNENRERARAMEAHADESTRPLPPRSPKGVGTGGRFTSRDAN